jgi:peptidyl-Asp metalloendopeptidase
VLDRTAARLAGLPDHRALRTAEVVFDARALGAPGRAPEVGQRIALSLFPGERVVVEGERIEAGVDGTWTWVGKPLDDPFGEVILSVDRGGRLYGTGQLQRRAYQVHTARNGRHYAEELDPNAFDQCSTAAPAPASASGKAAVSPQKAQGPGESRTIDVAVVYTARAQARQYSMGAFINNAVASMNSSFQNSGVNGSVRVVHYGPTAWAEPAGEGGINDFNVTDKLNLEIAGRADLQALRTQVRADTVLVIADATAFDGTCGSGQLLAPSQQLGASNVAYALTGDTCTGLFRNFSHELGHVLGGNHDKYALQYENGVEPDIIAQYLGPYSYSFGWAGSSGQFRTIMGSRQPCSFDGCARLNYWSSPSRSYAGEPMGHAADGDMSRSLNDMIPYIAQYRTSGQPAPGTPGSLTVTRGNCYGMNSASWTAASGTVGWYELERSTSAAFSSPAQLFRGPREMVEFSVSTTNYLRVRACNAEGCSAWRQGNMTATYTAGCF